MKRFLYFIILLCFGSLCACFKTFEPFTLEKRQRLDAEELKQGQFDISETLLLRAEEYIPAESAGSDDPLARDSKLRVTEVRIPRHTPGVVREQHGKTLQVQFETEENLIPFTRTPIDLYQETDPKNYVYQLREKELFYEGKRFAVSFMKQKARVVPENKDLYVSDPENGTIHYYKKTLYPILLIEHRFQAPDIERNQKQVPGKTVQEELTEKSGDKADEAKSNADQG